MGEEPRHQDVLSCGPSSSERGFDVVRSRSHGRQRAYFYVRRARLDKGVCDNSMWLPLSTTDSAVLGYLEGELLHPDVITESLRRLFQPESQCHRSRWFHCGIA